MPHNQWRVDRLMGLTDLLTYIMSRFLMFDPQLCRRKIGCFNAARFINIKSWCLRGKLFQKLASLFLVHHNISAGLHRCNLFYWSSL